jgi:CheY-like chemotaxis protein
MDANALLGEPDPSLAAAMTQTLSALGVSVIYATDAESVLARAQDATPSLVILADDLWGVSGFSVCSRLRRLNGMSHLPVVILVAPEHARDAVAHKSSKTHADAYLGRSPNEDDLRAVLSRVRMMTWVRSASSKSKASPGPPPLPKRTQKAASAAPAPGSPARVPPPPLPVDLPENPFAEPSAPRPPVGGSAEDLVKYFRERLKEKEELIVRGKFAYQAAANEARRLGLELVVVRDTLAKSQNELDAARRYAETLNAETDNLQHELAGKVDRIGELEAAMNEAQEAAEQTQTVLAESRDEVDRLTTRLAQVEADAAAKQHELQKALEGKELELQKALEAKERARLRLQDAKSTSENRGSKKSAGRSKSGKAPRYDSHRRSGQVGRAEVPPQAIGTPSWRCPSRRSHSRRHCVVPASRRTSTS